MNSNCYRNLPRFLVRRGRRTRRAAVICWVAAAGALAAAPAWAADNPLLAPPPAWVTPRAAPADAPADNAAVRVLLFDQQVNFGQNGEEAYTRSVVRLQTPQALAGLGTLHFSWRPDTDLLTVHHIRVIHDGRPRDIVTKAGDFTILRRENNLEAAALDGVLTATVQVEGLEVGDVVDVALTNERRDPVLKGHSERLLTGWPEAAIGSLHVAARWENDKPVRWRATDLPGAPTRAGRTGLTLDAADVRPLVRPSGAPTRFQIGRQLELSDFRSWAEVSDLFAPLYTKARLTPPASPLAGEIARIRALSTDPARQVEAALELVQDRVRYVFLGLNDGNLVPAPADLTWQRRFGDCKGKTALLLALLDGLGIAAEPALVSTLLGDGLAERLPGIGNFNHVLVRAAIAGKVYWLDGTRAGDTALARLRAPPFTWALPVRAGGAQLERLVLTPPDVPDMRTLVRLDASAGITLPARAHVETVLTGDSATAMAIALQSMASTDLDRQLRDYWRGRYDFIVPEKVVARPDRAAGSVTLTMDGTATMDWHIGDRGFPYYRIDGASLGWRPDFVREDGPHRDAPYAVGFPSFVEEDETIILPLGPTPFVIRADDEDRTAAGRRFRRTVAIAGNILEMKSSVRALVPEFPASEAGAATQALRDMAEVNVTVSPPADYNGTAAEVAALRASSPTTPEGLTRRGVSYMREGRNDEALADYGRALAIKADYLPALISRAELSAFIGKTAQARTDADKVLAIAPANPFALKAKAQAAISDGKPAEALALLDKAFATGSMEPTLYVVRADARRAAGDEDGALKDLDRLVALMPANPEWRRRRASIYRGHGEMEKAAADGEALVKLAPDDPNALNYAGAILMRSGKVAAGNAAFEHSLALAPTADTYLTRAQNRPVAQLAEALADFEAALKLDPKRTDARAGQANLRYRSGDFKGAATVYADLLRNAPDAIGWRVGLGGALARAGDAAGARKAFAAIRARPDADGTLRNALCWEQATAGFALEQALADCQASLAARPNPATRDSLGFVLLRLGRHTDSIAAYDLALKERPNESASLFGRGLARLAAGQTAAGEADLAAARKRDSDIDQRFRGYGLTVEKPAGSG